MFFILPLGHDRGVYRYPFFTVLVMALCLFIELWSTASMFTGGSGGPIAMWGYRPVDGLNANVLLSTFVHAGWLHLAGNLVFLWMVGCNLEDRWGRGVFAAVYLTGGVIAALAFGLRHPESTIPLVGASGAIAAAMGAFLVVLYQTQIRFFYFYWLIIVAGRGTFFAPAYVAFPIWVILQIVNGIFESGGGGVAYTAHIVGFAFGCAVALGLKYSGYEEKLLERTQPKEVEWEVDHDLDKASQLEAAQRPYDALALLSDALTRQPENEDYAREVLRLAFELGDTNVLQYHASDLVVRSVNNDPSGAIELFRAVTEQFPNVQFTDRALAMAQRAAADSDDAGLSLHAANRLLAEHPQSPLVARSMWDAAKLQQKNGRVDLWKQTLNDLIRACPGSAFAEQARVELEG